ncbi:efflux RND transporter periplasmic adaptor subunit [Marinihelvus fidelis]|uniref:Efflux RND transporter periplasmic adaptor subunit n=1 Tax=Marinihelvus fidelis TaxID=2613842 RepID=A0A5N0TG31_9GAMM|nr:efflux RND transporter periplasmic adaptor subunit [Marinihelvus fidelis]KAA9133561.1 efflux RND transporter periplasmic adaptor subunit [Marinihelvus fidelis]
MLTKFFRYLLPLGLIVLSIIVLFGLVARSAAKRPERNVDEQQAVLVETIRAETRSLNLVVRSQGAVRPRTETTLVAEVSGRIVSVSPNFVAGGSFSAGETLLEIDPSDYAAAVKRAEAALASRHALLADEQARSEQAIKDWRNLGKSGDVPELVARKPQLADATANVLAAEADLEKARRDLQRTRISVPYDGLVREKIADIGQYAAPGAQLGVTFAVDSAEIRLPVSAADLAYLELPGTAEADPESAPAVSLQADVGGTARRWDARIIRTEGVIDEASRVLYAVAQVVDPYGLLGQSTQPELRVGTFVSAAIEGRHVDNVVVLPRYVLRNDNTVLVANAENELEVRQVGVVRAGADVVYIDSGVSDGERVVTTTLDAPIPGTRLAIAGEPAAETE